MSAASFEARLTLLDGIIAQTCYDAQSVVGLVRAAERQKSPAILQLFPVTLAYGGGPFLQYCLTMQVDLHFPWIRTDMT